MRGKKHSEATKEKALALLATNNSLAETSRQMHISISTLQTWKNQHEKDADFVELRKKKKEEFVNNAWKLIEDSVKVAQERVTRELSVEESIDKIAEILKKNANEIDKETGVGWFELLDLIEKLRACKNFKLSELSTLIGTMYDKQALANDESTVRVDVKLEDLLKKVEGKSDY